MWKILFAVLVIFLAQQALAQQRMEIFTLKHRLTDQVLPVLQPLLEPGGSMSAMSGKVIVRASSANIEQLRQALNAIDNPARRLMVTVRQGGSAQTDDTRVGLDGRVQLRNGELSVDARGQAYSRDMQSSGTSVQTVQTLEGGEAYVYLGKSVPLPMTQLLYGQGGAVVSRGVQYVDVGSGFSVRPQLAGDQVTMTIAPLNQQIGRGGVIEGGRLQTTVRGGLGQWLSLGGSSQQAQTGAGGLMNYERGRSEQSSEYWIRVEALD